MEVICFRELVLECKSTWVGNKKVEERETNECLPLKQNS
jgi:hypothetical protein